MSNIRKRDNMEISRCLSHTPLFALLQNAKLIDDIRPIIKGTYWRWYYVCKRGPIMRPQQKKETIYVVEDQKNAEKIRRRLMLNGYLVVCTGNVHESFKIITDMNAAKPRDYD